ncbi:histidinol dehydrogenase [Halobacteriales archaeon QS_8_69_26]|nr:MAG: histidinol dehydrogenase [Halobacteriales archaeon QS_8_69_26]
MQVREIRDLSPADRSALFDRSAGIDEVRGDVREIIARVREEGDVAVREYTEEFDDVQVGTLDVTGETVRAYDRIDDDLRTAIDEAAENVRQFHEAQLPDDWRRDFGMGRELGRRFLPIDRVGVYVPGGSAAYPSSAIMGVVPATVAGVEEVAVATPPEPHDATLAAVYAAGADAVYQVGGAQAVAALAYGTETVDRVRKIAGPGGRYVSAAKAEMQGDVDIDFVAGPSEILVVADGTADPDLVAADVVAQAEHDLHAAVAAVTADDDAAEAIADAIADRVAGRDREETVRAALDNEASGVFLARSDSEAVLFANEYAPEHLSIRTENPEALLPRIENAGSVFLGPYTPVAAGDYAAGPNHVLPTGGRARTSGGLSVDTFLRGTTVQRISEEALDDLSTTIVELAEAEGLAAHAESVRARTEDREQ